MVQLADGSGTTTSYSGLTTTGYDQNGHPGSQSVNALGEVVSSTDAAGLMPNFLKDCWISSRSIEKAVSMKTLCSILILVLGAFFVSGKGHYPASKEERQSRINALIASYDAMDNGFLDSQGKVIIIKEIDGKVVVSFMGREGESVYGGQAHVTYDPLTRRVVKVEAED